MDGEGARLQRREGLSPTCFPMIHCVAGSTQPNIPVRQASLGYKWYSPGGQVDSAHHHKRCALGACPAGRICYPAGFIPFRKLTPGLPSLVRLH